MVYVYVAIGVVIVVQSQSSGSPGVAGTLAVVVTAGGTSIDVLDVLGGSGRVE